jgi:hypothetical protein
MKIDIAAMPIGGKPPGFTEGMTGQGDPVRWQVLADHSAPGGRVIAETSRDTADYRFPICVCDEVTAKDVAVSVRFKAVAGEVDQAAGLIVRAQDEMNFYVAARTRSKRMLGSTRSPTGCADRSPAITSMCPRASGRVCAWKSSALRSLLVSTANA